jgi:hypothetical protein
MLFGFLPTFETVVLITIITFMILGMMARHFYEQYHCRRRPSAHALASAEVRVLNEPYVMSITPSWGNTVLLRLQIWHLTIECRAELKPDQVITPGQQLVQVVMKRTGIITECSPDWWVETLT